MLKAKADHKAKAEPNKNHPYYYPIAKGDNCKGYSFLPNTLQGYDVT